MFVLLFYSCSKMFIANSSVYSVKKLGGICMVTMIKTVLLVFVLALIGASALLVSAITSQKNAINEAEAEAIAQQTVEGEISEVEFESGVYEVEVKKDEVEREVAISAQTGEVLSVEEDDEDAGEDVPITGTPLERASAAALKYVGEGRVTDSEIGDEEGYYEIEIRLNNGREVDVHLDENFNVLSTEYD
jgi:uncharacterized membrane protein YkoI